MPRTPEYLRVAAMTGAASAGVGLAAGYSPILGAAVLAILVGTGIAVWSLASPLVLLVGAMATIVLGQAGRIPPLSGSIPVLDLVVAGFAGAAMLTVLASRKGFATTPAHLAWLAFLAVALLTLVLTPLHVGFGDLARNGLYWVRLLLYGSVLWFVPMLADDAWKRRLYSALVWCGMAVVGLGFLQLAVFPDIGPLASYGWDPHIGRLVSSFLDPNYLGGYLAVLLAAVLGAYLGGGEGRRLPWLTAGLVVVASVLTYSRSGYLAVAAVVFFFGLRYSWKLLLLALAVITPLALSIPRVQERVAGGFSVDGTSQARIKSWQDALTVIGAFPVTGVGYNNYGNAQVELGIIPSGTEGHSINGSDSSLLNVQATTGAIGFGIFVAAAGLLLRAAVRETRRQEPSVAKSAAYALLLAAPAMFVHSFFVNGLFYPFLLLPLMVLAGLMLSGSEE